MDTHGCSLVVSEQPRLLTHIHGELSEICNMKHQANVLVLEKTKNWIDQRAIDSTDPLLGSEFVEHQARKEGGSLGVGEAMVPCKSSLGLPISSEENF
jgi:hypothetical protein